jgi:hypothetical protein
MSEEKFKVFFPLLVPGSEGRRENLNAHIVDGGETTELL